MPRRLIALTMMLATLLSVSLAAVAGAPDPTLAIAAPSGCDQAPMRPLAHQQSDLDHVAGDWGVFCEPSPVTGGFAVWGKQNVASPSLDGEALECALAGGAPYANIHCYRNLAAEPGTIAVTTTLMFQLLPGPSCADPQTACSQALEFSVSRWQNGQRYEWALQWQNAGGPCPRWRYWDPQQSDRWVALDPPLAQTLHAGRWYTLTLVGEIWQGHTRYVQFDIADQAAPPQHYFFGPLDLAPVSASNLDLLSAAVQLDGRYDQAPYSAVLDQVALRQASQPAFLGLPQRLYLPLAQSIAATPPSDGCATQQTP